MKNENFFRDMFQKEIVDPGWIHEESTLNIILSFFVYNPNLYLIQERTVNIEFIDVGGFINIDHQPIIANIKFGRNVSDDANTALITIISLILISLQLYIISCDLEDKELYEAHQNKMKNKEEEAEREEELKDKSQVANDDVEEPGTAKKKLEEKKKAEKLEEEKSMTCKERVIYVCKLFASANNYQKSNFLMIVLVWAGQIIKAVYDQYAMNWLKDTIKKEDYYDMYNLYVFN